MQEKYEVGQCIMWPIGHDNVTNQIKAETIALPLDQ